MGRLKANTRYCVGCVGWLVSSVVYRGAGETRTMVANWVKNVKVLIRMTIKMKC